MHSCLLWTLVFFAGASLTRLINKDKLLMPWRDRVEAHYLRQRWRILTENNAQALTTHLDTESDLRSQIKIMEFEAYREAERGNRTWMKVASKVDWAAVREGFLGCPWCVSFWVYLIMSVTAWWIALGAAYVVLGAPFWFTIPMIALAFRWIYGVVAGWVDSSNT